MLLLLCLHPSHPVNIFHLQELYGLGYSCRNCMLVVCPSHQPAFRCPWYHFNDVIMGAIASQITSLTIVYSTVYSDADQRKHESSASLTFVRRVTDLCAGNSPGTGEFPAKMASNGENVSIWWRHHDARLNCTDILLITPGDGGTVIVHTVPASS